MNHADNIYSSKDSCKGESTKESSSNCDKSLLYDRNHSSIKGPVSLTVATENLEKSDLSSDSDSSVTLCSEDDLSLEANSDHESICNIDSETNSPSGSAGFNDENSIADLFKDDSSCSIGDNKEVNRDEIVISGIGIKIYNLFNTPSGCKTSKFMVSKTNETTSNNQQRARVNSSDWNGDPTASNNENSSNKKDNASNLDQVDQPCYSERRNSNVKSDKIKESLSADNADSLLYDDGDETEYFIGSLKTKVVCSKPARMNLSQNDRLVFQNGYRTVCVLDFNGKEHGELHWKTTIALRQILDQNIASVHGRVLKIYNFKKNIIPIEVRFHCKNENIERLHTILEDNKLALSDSEYLHSDLAERDKESGMAIDDGHDDDINSSSVPTKIESIPDDELSSVDDNDGDNENDKEEREEYKSVYDDVLNTEWGEPEEEEFLNKLKELECEMQYKKDLKYIQKYISLKQSVELETDADLQSEIDEEEIAYILREKKFQDRLDRLFEEGYKEDTVGGLAEPSEIITTKLHKHQKEALYWMIEKENSNELPPFWKEKNGLFVNTLTDEMSATKPKSVRGGILADDMGLGKTLVIISLIASNTKDQCTAICTRNDRNDSIKSECDTTDKDDTIMSPAQCNNNTAGRDDEAPGCSYWATQSVDQNDVVPREDGKQNESVTKINSGSDNDSDTDFWRNPFRKRKHAESDSSDGYNSDESSIFRLVKRKCDKTRNSTTDVRLMGQDDLRCLDTSDPVIIISDDEELSYSEATPQLRDEDKGGGSPRYTPQIDCANANTSSENDTLPIESEQENKLTGDTIKPMTLLVSRGTLVICPATVLSTWKSQFDTHVHRRRRFKIYSFHGSNRITDRKFLARKDVVLTTYGTVNSDFKRKRHLYEIKWHRIVLDEGHEIRNPAAQRTNAICSLQSCAKWVLSGTPIQNYISDLWSLINFLEIHPLTDRLLWSRLIEKPLKYQKETAFRRLQHLVCKIAMRRTKDILNLPKREEEVQRLEFSVEENEVYRKMHDEAKPLIAKFQEIIMNRDTWTIVHLIMLRLRQMCCHPALCANNNVAVSTIVALRGGIDEDTRQELVQKLLKVLKSKDMECSICIGAWNNPVITPCKHVYCKDCIMDYFKATANPTCPYCRAQINSNQLVEAKPEDLEPDARIDISVENFKHSSKTRALLKSLIKLREEDPSTKSIVVSFFTSFLDIIQVPLRAKGFSFLRLDCRMTLSAREKAVSSFMETEPDSPTIMLLSLKAGGQGITLTAASRVFLMEPWFNPAAEQQCFDRCHRLGQTKDVLITKFIMKDSIEEGLLEVQQRKLELMREAFRKPTYKEKKLQTIQNVRTAFGL